MIGREMGIREEGRKPERAKGGRKKEEGSEEGKKSEEGRDYNGGKRKVRTGGGRGGTCAEL